MPAALAKYFAGRCLPHRRPFTPISWYVVPGPGLGAQRCLPHRRPFTPFCWNAFCAPRVGAQRCLPHRRPLHTICWYVFCVPGQRPSAQHPEAGEAALGRCGAAPGTALPSPASHLPAPRLLGPALTVALRQRLVAEPGPGPPSELAGPSWGCWIPGWPRIPTLEERT